MVSNHNTFDHTVRPVSTIENINTFSSSLGTNGGGGFLGGTHSSLSIKGTAFLRNLAPNGFGGGICATHTKKPVVQEAVVAGKKKDNATTVSYER